MKKLHKNITTDLIKSNYKVKILKKVLYELNTENNISTNKKRNKIMAK